MNIKKGGCNKIELKPKLLKIVKEILLPSHSGIIQVKRLYLNKQ